MSIYYSYSMLHFLKQNNAWFVSKLMQADAKPSQADASQAKPLQTGPNDF